MQKNKEIKIYLWYLVTEPYRALKKSYFSVRKFCKTDNLIIAYIFFATIIFLKNRDNPTWIIVYIVAFLLLLLQIWKSKHFIYRYRLEQEKKNE